MSNKKPTKKPMSKGKPPSAKKEPEDIDGGDTFLTDMLKRKPSNNRPKVPSTKPLQEEDWEDDRYQEEL